MTIRSRAGRAAAVDAAPTPAAHFQLGAVSARGFGIVFTASAMLNLLLPELDRIAVFLPALAGFAVVIGGFVLVGRRGRFFLVWVLLTYLAGLAALVAFQFPGDGVDDSATLATLTAFSSMAIPSLIVAIADRPHLPALVAVASLPVFALAVPVAFASGRAAFVVIAIVGGWLGMTFAGVWLSRSARRAEAGVEHLRQGYAAERRSTGAEAELRYGARVLHDTVLATLSVIAHSGVGVPPAALRAQAGADSDMLAQLRTRGRLAARADPSPGAPAAPPRSSGLRAVVDAWAAGHDFVVTWHGAEQFDAPAAACDALVRAVLECLENVRRHSGEHSAEVTLSQDPALVRVVITDLGTGFDRALVPQGRLGLTESVEARIRAVGGAARIFSSPGVGTTVLLEVPR